MSHHHEDLKEILERVLHLPKREQKQLKDILDILFSVAQSATFKLKGDSQMPATIKVGQTTSGVFTEFDGPNGTGNVVAPSGPLAYASDNAAVATVDPASGIVTGVSAGTCNIGAQDPASANKVTASDSCTVIAAGPLPALSATFVLSQPASSRR
jgi:hypothetical protein